MTTTFTTDQENELINHVLDFEIRMYGLTAIDLRRLAFQGVFVPPMVIFCRKRMKAELMDGAPPGTIFGCNDSGWMKLDLFEQWFDHFLTFTKPTKEEPVLLILDGHLTHTKNLNVVIKAKENNVLILCLPPHTTHKLQPLDVGVMYPLSTYMDQSLEKWMNNNPGQHPIQKLS
ncbi:DDE superfamily endonuclease [Popillia japonica]|uniref:DDE superfamily endonuclease n=1 Tax=Popillia japonica TaxID=7064 RepID=A0AAW1HY78_POPJA